MALILGLVALAGHIALLLWGTRMVQTGIQRTFGPDLRSFLGRALSNRTKAFLRASVSPPSCRAVRQPA